MNGSFRWSCRTAWARFLPLGLVAIAICASRPALADEARIGRKIADFSLHDARGTIRSLKDYSDAKLVVVAFLGTECPLANAYLPRLAELSAEWKGQGVTFLAINSNQQDSITEVAAHAQRMEIPFPVLKDPANEIADRFGAVRTPEVFVLDGDRVVRYWGRIDDQYGVGYQRKTAGRRDLAVAIEELLAGKPVTEPMTDATGCLIGRVKRADPSGDVTYSKQIGGSCRRTASNAITRGRSRPSRSPASTKSSAGPR